MTTERDHFVMALALILMFVIAVGILGAVAILYIDYNKPALQVVCDTPTGAAMWFYDGAFVRDLNRTEKTRWCPKWTPTAYPVYQYTPYQNTPSFGGTNP